MFWKKKKKEEVHKGDVFLADGIYLRKPILANGSIVLNCFWRSLIVCLLTFGSIGGFLSAFDISYNIILVLVFYMLLSAFFSFLYAAPKMIYRDIGYILFFGVFLVAIYMLRVYANSGFYAVINGVLSRAQSFFDLSGVREYEVQIDNNYLTIAIMAIFVGMVMIIVLNIWMYSTMSVAWTILFTFPILIVPLYMLQFPNLIFVLALCIGYIAVIAFKGNGHYVVFAWDAPFRVKGFKKDRVTYTQDACIFKQVLASLLILLFCVVAFTQMVMPVARFNSFFKEDGLRERTKEAVGNFVLLGFEGLYNRYAAAGGMSGGRLGGISNVRADYQPDLYVTYAPYDMTPVYLKGYTGGIYGDNKWESIYGDDQQEDLSTRIGVNATDRDIFVEESMYKEAMQLEEEVANSSEYSAYGKMIVRNVGANGSYLYYPYYTVFSDYSIYNNHSWLPTVQGLQLYESATYNYYPKVVWESGMGDISPKQMDVSSIDSVFLDVPEKNEEVIREECEKIGLNDTMTENEIMQRVVDYFEENIPYTLKPGATPRGKDFINYFLTKNRKGYCAHFASAATLLFREMGIPARYVEGYAITLDAALTGEMNEQESYESFFGGYSAIGKSTVLDVEVTDAMAHAWVEAYIDGFGWKVIEVTPSSMETSDEDDFWSAFSQVLSYTPDVDDEDGGFQIQNIDFEQYSWLVYIIFVIAMFFVWIQIVRVIVRKVIRYRKQHQKDEGEALIAIYADICEMLRILDCDFLQCKSHVEQLCYICERYEIDFDCEKNSTELERLSYSKEGISMVEMQQLREWLKEVRKAIWKQENMKKRIQLLMR